MNEKKKEYKNYIFDLYGTLVDIHCDEEKGSLWRLMKDFYGVYGCRWKKKKLRKRFFEMDREERKHLAEKIGCSNPEIRLERVFVRLLLEAPEYTDCSTAIAGRDVAGWRKMYENYKEQVLSLLTDSDWVVAAANLFRIGSREYFRLYENTISTLTDLRVSGKKVYLLSNAQKIFTLPEIEQLGLDKCFDKMYISSDAEIMKPQKEFMELLLTEEGLSPAECVMVGNEPHSDCAVALRCGVDSILLNTAHASEKEVRQRLRELLRNEELPEDRMPEVILSGDIREILK